MPISKKKKVVAAGLWIDTSGLTRVMDNVLKKVSEQHDVTLVGIGYKGPERKHGQVRVLPCNVRGGDMHGVRQLDELFRKEKPDVFFLCCDLAFLPIYDWLIKKWRDSLFSILYVPIDGSVLNPNATGFMPKIDLVVAYNQFGLDTLEKAFDRIEGYHQRPRLTCIPHGIDCSSFYPISMEERNATFEHLIGRTACQRSDPFIVLNANRPHYRKRIDLTLAGFALFAKDKPDDVLLYLHHARTTKEERKHVLQLIQEYDVQQRVILNDLKARKDFLKDAELNALYNICSVGINTSMGEGWGLVSFEHAATGAAQIVPDHSACGELWNGYGHLIPADKKHDLHLCNSRMKEVNPNDVASALNRLYEDSSYRIQLGRNGQQMVTRPGFEWKNIQEQWLKLFNGETTAAQRSLSRPLEKRR